MHRSSCVTPQRQCVPGSFGSNSRESSSNGELVKSADSFFRSLDKSIDQVMRSTRAPQNFLQTVEDRPVIVEKLSYNNKVPRVLHRPSSAFHSRYGKMFKGRAGLEVSLRNRRMRPKKEAS